MSLSAAGKRASNLLCNLPILAESQQTIAAAFQNCTLQGIKQT
jgi:hypothetical protein